MSEILQKIRDVVNGKKTIITAVIGILTAALAWAAGELTDWQAVTAVWVAVQIIFLRMGSKNESGKASDDAYNLGFTEAELVHRVDISDAYVDGFQSGYEQGDEDARYEDEE